MVIHSAWGLVLVSLGAAFLPSVGRWVRLPSIVLEIFFGILIGKSCLNLQFGGDWITFLAHLGFLILMFHAGMEINFKMLKNQSAGMFAIQAAVFAATLILSIGGAALMGQGLYLGLVLSTTSLGLVVPILKETKIIQSAMGQMALIACTLADFLTLFAITFFLLWHQNGFGWEFLKPLPFFLGFGVILKIVQFLAWWYPEKTGRLLADHDSQELGVRFSLALMFLFVALSELVHLEPVLGAFLGGAMLSIVFQEKTQLELKFSAFGYGFLVPIFFINIGMNFDIANVLSVHQLLFTGKLFVFAVAVKVLPAMIFVLAGLSFFKAFTLGMLMTSRLSLILVAATLGLEFGLITETFKDAIILLVVVTCISGPGLFKLLSGVAEKSGSARSRIERKKLDVGWMREEK
ncbi:MAG: cation:proton antiporter [Desulfobacteraceae bacterium]